jgi:hypothetical protein
MSHPAEWLAVLRIVTGLYFLKEIDKLSFVLWGGFLPWPTVSERWVTLMPTIVARQAAEHPIAWYKAFLENTVIPNAHLFASLTAWGEVVTGLSLTFGLFNGIGATVGLWLALVYGLATIHLTPAQRGLHLMLVTAMICFQGARAGRAWGLDGWLAQRSEAWWTKRPWS